MRKLACLFAVAAVGGLMSASVASAGPLAAGLSGTKPVMPVVEENSVQQVHGWHCRKRYGWFRGHKYSHRHRRACYDYDDYDDYDYGYSYHPYPFYGAPFFSFHFGDDDGHRRRHKHRHHKKKRKHYD